MAALQQEAVPGSTHEDLGIDLFTMFMLMSNVGDQHSMAALSKAGYTGLRPSHGFLIGLLRDGPRTVGEMAPRLQVTQQAVSKTVRELASNGYVEQLHDDGDRRRRPVTLTQRGRDAVALAWQARQDLIKELESVVDGDQPSDTASQVEAMMEHLGLMQQLRDRRVPMSRDLS